MKKALTILSLCLFILASTKAQTVSFGSEYNAFSGSNRHCQSVKLTETTFIVAYIKGASAGSVYGRVGTISNGLITYGAEAIVAGTAVNFRMAALTSTSIIIAYVNVTTPGSASAERAVVCTISGETITRGTAVLYSLSYTSRVSVTALNSSSVILGTGASSSEMRPATISGTNITLGTTKTESSYVLSNMTAIGSTTFIAAYTGGSYDYGYCSVCSVSSGVITVGTKYVFNSTPNSVTEDYPMCPVSSTSFIIGDLTGILKVGTISGSAITYGSANTYTTNSLYFNTICSISSTLIAILYASSNQVGYTKIGTISGSSINFGGEVQASTSMFYDLPSLIGLSSASLLISYTNSNGTYARNRYGSLPSGKKINGLVYSKWNGATITKFNNQ